MRAQKLIKIGSTIGGYGSPIQIIHPSKQMVKLTLNENPQSFIDALKSHNIWAKEKIECETRATSHIVIPKPEHFSAFGHLLAENCSFENSLEFSWFKYVMGMSSTEFTNVAQDLMKQTIFEINGCWHDLTLKSVRGNLYDKVQIQGNGQIRFTLFENSGHPPYLINPAFPPYDVIQACAKNYGIHLHTNQKENCINELNDSNNFIKMIESLCQFSDNSKKPFNEFVQDWRCEHNLARKKSFMERFFN